MMGFSEGLIEIVGKDKFKDFHFAGVSAGCAVSLYFYSAVNSNHNMKYW